MAKKSYYITTIQSYTIIFNANIIYFSLLLYDKKMGPSGYI